MINPQSKPNARSFRAASLTSFLAFACFSSSALAQWEPFNVTNSSRSTTLQNVSDCGGIVFFGARNSTSDSEPAVTYGTLASTRFVADIYPGSTGSNPGVFTRIGDWVYYAATDNANGRELWKSHVTTLETTMVKNIRPGSFSSNPHDFGVVNGKLLFSANADPTTTGDELWISDGTDAGTILVKDIYPGSSGSFISGRNGRLFVLNGVAYFKANSSTYDQLWRSDGTSVGTFLLYRNSGANSSRPTTLTAFNNQVYFFVKDTLSGNAAALWKTDGSFNGTVRVKSPVTKPTIDSFEFPPQAVVVNGLMFFRGGSNPTGYELWRTDGSENGTMMVKDILNGGDSGDPQYLTAYENRVYFVADDGVRGTQIWSSDGTSNGTVMVHEVYNATNSNRPAPSGLTVFGDYLFFNMLRDGFGREWWTTDGINLSNGPAFDLNPGSGSGIDEDDVKLVVGSSFYFDGFSPSVEGELWRLNPPSPTRILGLSGSLSFGSVNAGSPEQKNLTLSNTGSSPLTIIGITYPPGFSGNWSGTIAPGASQTVVVTFTPTAPLTYTGTITVLSNKTSGTDQIPCSGIGIAADIACEEPTGIDRNSGSTIQFGSQPRGFVSTPSKTIVIRNLGNAPLTITGIALTGSGAPDFIMPNPKLPLVLAPKSSTKVTAAFKPTSEGSKAATLQITSNDIDEGQFDLTFSGSGIAPAITFAASQGVNSTLPSYITSLGQVVSISGLPAGVKYDAKTGNLIGRPTVPGSFTARVSIKGSNGKTTITLMTILVEPLPLWSLGTFTSFINPPTTSDATLTGLGGYLSLKIAAAGTYTGSLRLGAKAYSIRGQIEGRTATVLGGNPLLSTATIITNSKDRTQDITLNFELRPGNHSTLPGPTGNLIFQGRTLPINPGWQHVWHATTNPAFGNKDRTINAAIDNTTALGPQGDGFATIKLTRSGLASWAVTLSNGRKLTGSFAASPAGNVAFYAPIAYPNGGALSVRLTTAPLGELYQISSSVNGRWIKLPTTNPKTIDRTYRSGFDLSLTVTGAEHRAPARAVLLFGNPTPPKAMSFTLTGAGIQSSFQLPGTDPVNLTAELRTNNVIAVPPQSGLPTTLRIAPSFSPTSGLMSGSITLSDIAPLTTKATSRTLSYRGLYIPNLTSPSTSRLRGFFTLTELPDTQGETTTNTPILSGSLNALTR